MSHKSGDMYILMDPLYMPTYWGEECRQGLDRRAAKNGIHPVYMTDLNEAYRHLKNIYALVVVSARTSWVEYVIQQNRLRDIKTILVGSPVESFDEDLSGPVIDRRNATEQFLRHFILNGRKSVASVGNKTDDYNDMRRAELFLKAGESFELPLSSEDIFYDSNGISGCLDSFFSRAGEYSAAICVNDYVAVLLAKRAKRLGIRVPEDLFICGAGNMLTGLCCTPNITTSTLSYYEMGKRAVNIWMMLNEDRKLSSVRMFLTTEIIWRESTGNCALSGNTELPAGLLPKETDFPEPQYADVELIENCLQQCDMLDLRIIDGILKRKSFETIAEDAFVSVGTVYYRLKRIYSRLHVSGRNEFTEVMRYVDSMDSLLAAGVLQREKD